MKNQQCEFSHLYKPAKKWEVINDGDTDLKGIYFSLPTPPPLHLIDGWGKHPDDQYFKRMEVPKKLRELEDEALNELYEVEKGNRQETIQGYKLYLKYWDLIDQRSDELEKEIEWLKKVWWHRTYGYWCFIDGEPTFIPPEYWDFLNFYYIAESKVYPEFRYDILRKSCFIYYLMHATETFADVDPQTGVALKKDGKYRMLDLGRRVFLGDIEPKTRRVGATHEGIHNVLFGTMTHDSFYATIISLEGQNAKTLYEQKLLPAWDNYPMCLKPIWEGNRRPSVLKLSAPPNVYHIKGLNSAVSFTEGAGEKKSEGKRLNRILADEQGKTMTADIAERHHVNKLCMTTGMGVNIIESAYCKNPSTVEEMDEGGASYYKIAMLSDFYRRIPSLGQTYEGLARIFLPAYLRLEGYIDRFGKSVVNEPTERQKKLSPHSIFTLSNKGAKQMLQEQRDALLREGTPQALEAYRSLRRKSPFNWSECWLGSSGDVGFNMEILDKRISEINRQKSLGKQPYRIGDLYREGGHPDGKVLWRDDIDNGKFRVSLWLPSALTNQRARCEYFDPIKGMLLPAWKPVNGHKFTLGADAFRGIKKNEVKEGVALLGRSSTSRQSDGGISIHWEYDATIDGGRSIGDRDSDRCVLTYRERPPTQEDYFEDVLMAAQFFGAMIYPEYNVERIVSYIIERGYWGYLLFDIDIMTGKPRAMPGRYTATETWQEVIPLFKDAIEQRGHKECHDDLLNEYKKIKGTESMTHLDLAASYGMALLGSGSRHREIISNTSSQPALDLKGIGLFRKRAI